MNFFFQQPSTEPVPDLSTTVQQYGIPAEVQGNLLVLHQQLNQAYDDVIKASRYDAQPHSRPKMYFDHAGFAAAVKSKRGRRGLREIAEEIGGISASTVSRIENGKQPDLDSFLAICDWLEVSPVEFIANAPGDPVHPYQDDDYHGTITIRITSRARVYLEGSPAVKVEEK